MPGLGYDAGVEVVDFQKFVYDWVYLNYFLYI